MTVLTIEQAALARAQAVAQRADRPQCRRASEEQGSGYPRAAGRLVRAEVTPTESNRLHFVGVASVVESPYEVYDMWGPYVEVVAADAFAECLVRPDLDVPLVLAHDSLRRIARTTNGSLLLSMSDEGLVVDAPDLDPEDADVAYIAPKLRAGLVDEMSFAFRIDAGEWSPDWSTFRVTKADIHRGDVAIVGYGANPSTHGGLRSQVPQVEQVRHLASTRLLPWLDAAIAG